MDEKDVPESAGMLSGGSVMALAELLQSVGAACTGYRQQLLDAGWPQVIADQVAGNALMTWQGRLLGGCRG